MVRFRGSQDSDKEDKMHRVTLRDSEIDLLLRLAVPTLIARIKTGKEDKHDLRKIYNFLNRLERSKTGTGRPSESYWWYRGESYEDIERTVSRDFSEYLKEKEEEKKDE